MLKNLAVLSVSFRRASLAALGELAKHRAIVDRLLWHLLEARELDEYAVLVTCNRFAVILAAANPCRAALKIRSAMLRADAEAGRGVEYLVGESAVRHLLRVAASLESLLVGEGQILRQVKLARDGAREAKTIGPNLELLFDHALAAAKMVRSRTTLADGRLSIVSLAARSIEDAARDIAAPAAAVIGAGDMARKAARYLRHQRLGRLVIVNRTRAHAEELAAELGADAMSLAEFQASPPVLDVLITATASPQALFGWNELALLARRRAAQRRAGHLIVVDLAVPGNVEPGVASELSGCRIRRLDDLRGEADGNRAKRCAEIATAEGLVEHKLLVLKRRLAQRTAIPLLARARAGVEELQLRQVDRLLRRHLPHLSTADQAIVRGFAADLARRCAERSMGTMRDLAAHVPEIDLAALCLPPGAGGASGHLPVPTAARDALAV